MNENDFKKWLNSRLGDPSEAPPREFETILRRIRYDPPKKRIPLWKPVLSFGSGLAVLSLTIIYVHPLSAPVANADSTPGSETLYSEFIPRDENTATQLTEEEDESLLERLAAPVDQAD